jgi:hypothetical protein
VIPSGQVGRTVAATYVLVVAVIATVGFTTDSTAAILLAGILALPSSAPGVVGLYLAVGFLGLVPGASPDSSSGSGCSTPTVCEGITTGELATWFTIATGIIGILALTLAAMLNVAVAHWLWRAIRGSASASGRSRSGA